MFLCPTSHAPGPPFVQDIAVAAVCRGNLMLPHSAVSYTISSCLGASLLSPGRRPAGSCSVILVHEQICKCQ